ncbi:TetR/AcrR family transcriptional regulator [Corynebacterium sp. HMSC04H06]|uniref:TetR/AcrR family transcriptional regulator n=1 Tax=Corynebacterium sp. HMSC04H06 TaxID=1581050 RepID=UPI0009F707B8|nr:TetR/AcrR family transcriptional regulator [Corynebacterium sp. HMSC04H06]
MTTPQARALRAHNERSKQETRRAVFQAVKVLAKDKLFADITASEIIRTAKISRSSFYRHFPTKDSVVEQFIHRVFDEIGTTPSARDSLRSYWAAVLDKTWQYREELTLAISAGAHYRILEELNKNLAEFDDTIAGVTWNGLLFNIIMCWADNDFSMPKEELLDRAVEVTHSLPEPPNLVSTTIRPPR